MEATLNLRRRFESAQDNPRSHKKNDICQDSSFQGVSVRAGYDHAVKYSPTIWKYEMERCIGHKNGGTRGQTDIVLPQMPSIIETLTKNARAKETTAPLRIFLVLLGGQMRIIEQSKDSRAHL
jgi:hypothetical protein